MFAHQGIWLPDGEKHFVEWMTKNGEMVDGYGTYQIKKCRAAIDQCKQFRRAIDVGGHVGTWSMQLAKRFEHVIAFEPVEKFRECWHINMARPGWVAECFPYALGAAHGRVAMDIPSLNGGIDSGGTHVRAGDDVEMRTLDSFNFDMVDFVKIDCEGYELEVLKGARETIERWRPTIIVEQKPHKLGANYGIQGKPAVDFLLAMGARHVKELGGDHILVFD